LWPLVYKLLQQQSESPEESLGKGGSAATASHGSSEIHEAVVFLFFCLTAI